MNAAAAAAADRYLALAGGRVRSLSVIGSAALGDWWPGASDLDLVIVMDPVDAADGDSLRTLHARLRDTPSAATDEPPFEVLYLEDGDLARPPAQIGPRWHHHDGLVRRDADMCTPVTWHSLVEHGVTLRGELPDIHVDDAALRTWCRGNLDGYWAGWASRGANSASRAGMVLLTDWGVCWCVLGVLRLRYTLATGQITSKSGAGRWALARPADDIDDHELIEQALAARAAAEPVPPADRDVAAARRVRALAFMRRVIDER